MWNTKYLKPPRSDFQKMIRRNGRKTLEKGDPLTDQEYANHSDKVIEKFDYMIKK